MVRENKISMTDPVTDQFSYLVAKIAAQLDARVKSVVACANLSPEQWRILALLDERDGRSMSDLAQMAFVEAATLTKMIDRLVSDAMVYRAPDTRDRRRVLVFLSCKALDRIAAIKPQLAAEDAAVTKRLGPLTVRALQAMSQHLEVLRREADRLAREPDEKVLAQASK